MDTLKRIAPAFTLLILSPLIAEFLLADFNIRQLGYLGIFIPLYGACALFIREIVRRTNRGWKSMLLLALGYGFIAEGIVNLTLFNPHYAGQDLIGYGFIPILGTSLNYGIFIVTLHTVWSISAPIAIAEGFAGDRATKPWLHNWQLAIVGLLGLLGLAGTTASTIERFHFVASAAQYASVIVILFALIFIAFKIFKPVNSMVSSSVNSNKRAPSIFIVLILSFLLSSAFQIWFHYAPGHKINASIGVLVFLALDVIAITLFYFWSRLTHWSEAHIVAAATGAILTYGWFGLNRLIGSGHTALGVKTTPIDIAGQVFLLVAILLICFIAIKKSMVKQN